MTFISPQPNTWYKIWLNLKARWEQDKMTCFPPPVALVLSGWTMSNDYDKQERWQQTLKWADTNNLSHLIPELKEDEKYFVDALNAWRPFEHFNFTEKYKPTKEEVQNAITVIKKNWTTYLDDTFAKKTNPLKLTGNKARRLLVKVEGDYQPPWGSWTSIYADKRAVFSTFRKNINKDISPLEIDHIDFMV